MYEGSNPDEDDLFKKIEFDHMNGQPLSARIIATNDHFVLVEVTVRTKWFWIFSINQKMTIVLEKSILYSRVKEICS